MKLFYFICIFLLGSSIANSQVLAGNGDSLFSKGEFELAALAFEYQAFSAVDKDSSSEFLFKKANCYKAIGEYQRSLEVLNRIRTNDRDLKKRLGYESALMYYLTDSYQLSYNELLKLKLQSKEFDPSIAQLEVLNLFALGKWEEAKSLIVADTVNGASGIAEYVFAGKIKYKDPEKAYKLSLFLPGIGQMYSGHFFKGVVSAGGQAGLVAFSALSIYNGYFWTGGMTGVAFFYTFYLGGARYAKDLAIKHNQEVSQILSQRYLKAIK